MADQDPTPHEMLTEACVFWSIGIVIFAGRIASRAISNHGIRHLRADDYVMSATFCFWTALLVLLQVSVRYATNLMDPADYASVLADPQDVKDRIFGSKITVAVEQCMLVTLWGVKTSLLILYYKLTYSLRENIFVKILAGYVLLGFLVIEITYFFVYCRPFPQYWAMPPSNIQCADYFNYCVTQTVFNVSSDAMLLAIPIPLIIKAKIPRRRKAILCCVFSMGIFVILAAILNKYYNFSMPYTTIYMIWHVRESSTSIFVANLMRWWPLLRKLFGLRSWSGASSRSGRTPQSHELQNQHRSGILTSFRGHISGQSRSMPVSGRLSRLSKSESEEAINKRQKRQDSSREGSDNLGPLEVWKGVEFDVEKSSVHPSSDEEGSKFDHSAEGPHKYNVTIRGNSLDD